MPTSRSPPCSRAANGACDPPRGQLTVRTSARRIEGLAHEIDLEGGHVLVVDEPPDRGGTDTGPRPTQLLAASLAGCTAITVEMYGDRKGWDLGTVEVEVEVSYDGPVPSEFDVALRL